MWTIARPKGYGRDWRTADLPPHGRTPISMTTWTRRNGLSRNRVPTRRVSVIYGGSYGGFITLMAMFTQPDVFAAGAALRPVSDWALLQPRYTGNILNLPQTDAEAYKQSSPIYFANGLKGAPADLPRHGGYECALRRFRPPGRTPDRTEEGQLGAGRIPRRGPRLQRAASWTDEYKRIFKLFETTLKK